MFRRRNLRSNEIAEISMKRLSLIALLALAASPALAAPQCMELRFLDANGVVVPVNPPMIGIMIGDAPLFEGSPPPHAGIDAGRIVSCPVELIASTQRAFDDFCTSDDRRKQAAKQNNADISLINKRCGDLSQTLAK